MKYICRDGNEYDLSSIPDVNELITFLKIAYNNAISADSFYFMVSRHVMQIAGSLGGSRLPFIIQEDLADNIRVRDGEISGDISQMFSE